MGSWTLLAVVLVGSFMARVRRRQPGKIMPMLLDTAQRATALNLLFILGALISAFFLPRTLSAQRAEENA
jgi:hypothetical protein